MKSFADKPDNLFGCSRAVYFGGTPSEAPGATDAEALKRALESAEQKTDPNRDAAVMRGRSSACESASRPSEKTPLPEIPEKMKGLKVSGQPKVNNETGTVEQEFKFGDLKIPGRITMPSNPAEGKKTTVVFNYVPKFPPDAESEKKFLGELKKANTDLGNVIVVTVRTPEGETNVDQKKVNTMATLLGELERFQEDLKKDSNKPLNFARAETVLHMTSPDQQQKVAALLQKYHEAARDNDPRVVTVSKLIDNNPDQLAQSLQKAVAELEAPLPAEEGEETESTDGGTVPSGGGGYGGGGGGGGGGGYGGGGGLDSEEEGGNESGAEADEDSAEETSQETPESSAATAFEGNDLAKEGVGRLLILGDSLLEVTQTHLAGKYRQGGGVETTAVRGKQLSKMRSELEKRKENGSLDQLNTENCRGTILVNGGGNDLAGATESQLTADDAGRMPIVKKITDDMKAMLEIARNYTDRTGKAAPLKIYFCALAPFGGTTMPGLSNNYDKKNQARKKINQQLYQWAADPELQKYLGVIPLDKKYSEGGLADDEDPDRLAEDVSGSRSGGGFDGVHLTPQGYRQMAGIIEKNMGPVADGSVGGSGRDAVPAMETGSATEPSRSPSQVPNPSEWEYVKDHRSVSALAAEYQEKWLREGKPVGYQEIVNYNGTEYLLTVMPHQVQARTGRRFSDAEFQAARSANWPLAMVGKGWLYAVEVKQRRAAA